ncbi:MAG: ATP-binding protein [Bacteroidia bacterium]|nr:ATP-binding protein [Bacteroidia bacterium]
MIKRTKYLNSITPFIRKPIIKAITGVRRCGKSTFLQQIISYLQESGADENEIIYINKELVEFDYISNYKELHKFVKTKLKNSRQPAFLLVDEIQEIENWEKAIASLLAEKQTDIYITGSNARLLSSELATLLSGRYIELKMQTLSFSEFIELAENMGKKLPIDKAFDFFLKYGGFPGIHILEWNDIVVSQYIQSVFNTILLKDIVMRYDVRDAYMLEKITHYLIDNCGNITSANRISEFLKSQKRKISIETVQNYIQYSCNAFLAYQVKRYDIRGKRMLESLEKYYLCDTGFQFATIGYTPEHLPGLLENIVMLDLFCSGYAVYIGKWNNTEIDFIAEKGNEKLYIQICMTLSGNKTIDREYRSLESINDHFPKLVLSLDKGFETSRKGIRWMNIQDFLLKK